MAVSYLFFVIFIKIIFISNSSIAKTNIKLVSSQQCERIHGLSSSQKRFCRKHFNFMKALYGSTKTSLSIAEDPVPGGRINVDTGN